MKFLIKTGLSGLLFALLLCPQISTAKQTKPAIGNDDFKIMRHEPLNNVVLASSAGREKASKAGQMPALTVLSFRAYGQKFIMELEPNDKLLVNLPKALKSRLKQSMRIYKGHIPGIEGSWVRLSRIGKRLSGAFWDGTELYLIDSSDEVKKALVKRLGKRNSKKPYRLIYRLSDIETNASCGSETHGKAFGTYSALVKELQGRAQALPKAAFNKLDVAIIADAQFTQANSANPQAAVVARMNVVDGIFSEQVGVHLNINEIRALTNNGVMSSTDANRLLEQLSEYTAPARFNNPGIAHLFTGRDLDGNTAGIAYIGVLCRNDFGVGLSMTGGIGTAGALTVAHEIGHNFGAPHDNQAGDACASTPGTFLMNPVLNGSTQFSECSLREMAPVIARASCITAYNDPNLNADVRPVIAVNPVNVNIASAFNYVVEVRNGGNNTAQNTTAKIIVPVSLPISSVTSSTGQCSNNGEGVVNCNLGNLTANASGTITINARSGTTPANLSSIVLVNADNDGNPDNNSATVAINVNSNTGSVLFQSDFTGNSADFTYSDDVFATKQPGYAAGNGNNGFLQVILGGVDDSDIFTGMSGGWSKSFSLTSAKSVTLSFDYRLTQAASYEPDEYSEAQLALDGRLIGVNGGSFLSRITGDGEEVLEPDKTTGVKHVDIDLGTLSAGNHTVTLGAFNNQKTFRDETTIVNIDNVKAVTR